MSGRITSYLLLQLTNVCYCKHSVTLTIIHLHQLLSYSNYYCICRFAKPIKIGTKDTRGTVKLINKLTTPWLKMKRTNRQTIVHITQHKQFKKKTTRTQPKTRGDLRCSGRS